MRILLVILSVFIVLLILTGLLTYAYFSQNIPDIKTLATYHPRTVTEVFSSDNSKIGEFFEERRLLIKYEDIPKWLIDAFIAAEDKGFWEHRGIDLEGILRAAISNIKAGRVVQGGSTLTQQVAKNLLLSTERRFSRKVKEQILAMKIEREFSKKQILYIYLNQIYLGHGAYGIQAAASNFFNKNIKDLTLAEAALLAGLVQAPSKLPNIQYAKERQEYVLTRMIEDKYITKQQADEALKQEIKILERKDINLEQAPYFTEHVRRYLIKKYGMEKVYREGLKVYTTLNLKMQKAAQKAVEAGIKQIDKRRGYRGAITNHQTNESMQSALRRIHQEQVAAAQGFSLVIPAKNDLKSPATNESTKEELTPIRVGDIVHGIVLTFDSNSVTVGVGNRKGTIPFDSMRWARTPNPDLAGWESPLIHPGEVLRVGDEILVKVTGITDTSLSLELEQAPIVQAALVSYDSIGALVAMVGGYSFEDSEFNRASQALRQPGSAFKPFIYSAALDKGFTPATIIVDSPIVYDDALRNQKWTPENYEQVFYGDTTLRTALIHSRNVVTIKILQNISVPYIIDYAKKLGFTANFTPDLSLALGSSVVALDELTTAYGIFMNHGRKLSTYFIKKLTDRDGNILEEFIPKQPLSAESITTETPSDQVISPQTAFLVTHLLREVVQFGTGRSIRSLGRPAAGKTGTTDNFTDALFIGFTPYILTGVWTGIDDVSSLGKGEAGGKTAAPIWLDYMKEATKDFPVRDFDVPEGIVFASIDRKTGKLATTDTEDPVYEAFLAGTEPKEPGTGGEQQQPGAEESEEFLRKGLQ
ncbi:MAG: hypothetical protein A3F16_01220 [Deltaproteobacteria bacterium RIFCSPHIGHO2_12_FULL_43_9]|nr:MAG: hypothetical protein A3F16_01220 [Deltaproteobacteria bacterium RIFCSPHIGHO2_12_FULL_43_9]